MQSLRRRRFLEPRNDDGGVKSTAVSEDDFLLGFCFSHFECPYGKFFDGINIELDERRKTKDKKIL